MLELGSWDVIRESRLKSCLLQSIKEKDQSFRKEVSEDDKLEDILFKLSNHAKNSTRNKILSHLFQGVESSDYIVEKVDKFQEINKFEVDENYDLNPDLNQVISTIFNVLINTGDKRTCKDVAELSDKYSHNYPYLGDVLKSVNEWSKRINDGPAISKSIKCFNNFVNDDQLIESYLKTMTYLALHSEDHDMFHGTAKIIDSYYDSFRNNRINNQQLIQLVENFGIIFRTVEDKDLIKHALVLNQEYKNTENAMLEVMGSLSLFANNFNDDYFEDLVITFKQIDNIFYKYNSNPKLLRGIINNSINTYYKLKPIKELDMEELSYVFCKDEVYETLEAYQDCVGLDVVMNSLIEFVSNPNKDSKKDSKEVKYFAESLRTEKVLKLVNKVKSDENFNGIIHGICEISSYNCGEYPLTNVCNLIEKYSNLDKKENSNSVKMVLRKLINNLKLTRTVDGFDDYVNSFLTKDAYQKISYKLNNSEELNQNIDEIGDSALFKIRSKYNLLVNPESKENESDVEIIEFAYS